MNPHRWPTWFVPFLVWVIIPGLAWVLTLALYYARK